MYSILPIFKYPLQVDLRSCLLDFQSRFTQNFQWGIFLWVQIFLIFLVTNFPDFKWSVSSVRTE